MYSTCLQVITVPTQIKYPKGGNNNEIALIAPVSNTHKIQNTVHGGYQMKK